VPLRVRVLTKTHSPPKEVPLVVALQARTITVLALSIAVVLPSFSFEIYSKVLTTTSFARNCLYVPTITFLIFWVGGISFSEGSLP